MAFLIKQMAKKSGVSVRTLHYYDEIGLLKPARISDKGYRYYEDEQLLMLQQIMFFRELGFQLSDIQNVLQNKDFDKVKALESHRLSLRERIDKMKTLLATIDKTIAHLKGEKEMKDKDLFSGFDPKKQEEYEQYLMNRLGADHLSFAESKRKIKGWTKADWEKSGKEWDSICTDLAKLKQQKLKVDSAKVQTVIQRHYVWLKQFWIPNRETYTGMGMGYTEFEWKKAFAAYDSEHPKLAMFLAKAMECYAKKELS